MTLSSERKINSKYVEAVTKEEEAHENEVCVIVDGVAKWVAPENVLVHGKPMGETFKVVANLVEAYNALFEKMNALSDEVVKCNIDIKYIIDHSEL